MHKTIINLLISILFFFDYNSKKNNNMDTNMNTKKNDKILLLKNHQLYFLKVEIPSVISLRNCKQISFFIRTYGISTFIASINSLYGLEDAKVLSLFIKNLNEQNVLQDFLIFFNTQKSFNIKEIFLLECISINIMIEISHRLFFELNQNNNLITKQFYHQLYNDLTCDPKERIELIEYIKSLNNISELIDFWLFKTNNNQVQF